jgi:SAM-dependent methyltransferase
MRGTEATGDFRYVGSELDLFAAALNWKAYWSRRIGPFLQGDTLEVGAGIGANTAFLSKFVTGRCVCLEPDPKLSARLEAALNGMSGARKHEGICGTLETLPKDESFDSIVYIDVLEHIEDDAGELRQAARRLRPGGRIVVLSPAHQFLYTPFDAAIGHFRRYSRSSLRKISPPDLEREALFYMDACGIAASAMNRLLLRQSMPIKAQIGTWDKWIIPASRMIILCFGVQLASRSLECGAKRSN